MSDMKHAKTFVVERDLHGRATVLADVSDDSRRMARGEVSVQVEALVHLSRRDLHMESISVSDRIDRLRLTAVHAGSAEEKRQARDEINRLTAYQRRLKAARTSQEQDEGLKGEVLELLQSILVELREMNAKRR